MTYEWRIVKLFTMDQVNADGDTLENAVVDVQWKKIATDTDGNTATYLGRTKLTAEDVASADFVGFTSLTQDLVTEWIQASISEKEMSKIDSILQDRINKKTVVSRMPPWA